MEKTKNTDFTFQADKKPSPDYSKEWWINHYDEWINVYVDDYNRGRSMHIYFDDLIEKIVKHKHWDIIDYLYHKETNKIKSYIKFKKEEKEKIIEEQKEKKVKKCSRRIIKNLKTFKEVEERKNADALLIINKNDVNNFYDIRLNDFTDDQIKIFQNTGYKIYFLKNNNQHDRRNSTYGLIKQMRERQHYN